MNNKPLLKVVLKMIKQSRKITMSKGKRIMRFKKWANSRLSSFGTIRVLKFI
jgi:hypothetical protein